MIVLDVENVPATDHDPHEVAEACLTDDAEVLGDLVGDVLASYRFVASRWLP